MKAIIFGINGQDGYFLKELLLSQGVEVLGVSRSGENFTKGDVSDFEQVKFLIEKNQPDFIFHFAAISTTKHSALFDNHKAISTGTLNILEGVRLSCPQAKVFLSGSAMQFKNEGQPINENTPFEAKSPYAVARIQSVYAGRYYRDAFGLSVYIGYFFNHDSVRRTEEHVNQKIVQTIKRIKSGSEEKLELGNIDVKKEFNYAGDIVEAVWMMVNQDAVFEAVIGCGEAHSIKEWVEYCFNKIGKNWQDYVTVRKNYAPEYDVLVSNPKLITSIGWKPKINFEKLADLMMEA
jgi:GDPmannose 4,6-dehydratase